MRLLPAITANLALFLSAVGFGTALRPLIPKKFLPIDRLAVFVSGGFGILGTLLFCVGQLRFSILTIGLLLLGGILLLLREGLRRNLHAVDFFAELSLPILPAIVIAVVVLLTAVAGLALPTGDTRMDAIAYHLLGPRVWSQQQVIRPVLDECMTAFPAVVETQFAALMVLGGQRAPEFYSILALLSLLIVAASLARRFGLGPSDTWWAVALTATMPVVYRGAYGGFIDVVYSGFLLLAARVAFDAELPADFALFGLFCGFAMGTKYFGLPACLLLLGCTFAVAVLLAHREKTLVLKNLALASAVALLLAAPWYLRNWIYLGCPIYPPPPPLPRFFAIRYLPPQAIQNFLDFFAKIRDGMGRGPLGFLLLPFHLTFHPANFVNGAGGIGLCPLALAPFGLLVRRRDPFAQGIVLFAFLQVIAWLRTGQDARYLIHMFVISAIFALFGWEYVTRLSPSRGRILAAVVVALSVSYGLFMIGSARREDLRAALSSSYEIKRRAEEVPFQQSFNYLNLQASATKVLVLDPRVPTYYLEKSYVKPTGRFGERSVSETTSQILSHPSQLHISHILDVLQEGGSFRLPDRPPGLTLVFETGDQRIYRVD